ncbi:MAG: SprB repeat-containing protein [Bacteroidota bacterium]
MSVLWAIAPDKLKDGTDFTYNSVAYKGGTFIIPAAFRTAAVNSKILSWQGLGVVGVTTSAPITLPYATLEINNMPQWTMDYQNGSIAVNFFTYAGIPDAAYGGPKSLTNWKAPADLNCCDDIFVMPHADPEWSTHGHLLDWNLDCKGAIWLGCHAGSALEDMFNPANPSQQTNFLSKKTVTATGAGPYYQNALVLWGAHSGGTIPYTFNYPTDPIMQFMGGIGLAQQNGSEQIYIPVLGGGWRPGAKVYVYDPTPVNTLGVAPFSTGPAATLVSGRGFDDASRGRVMLESAHNISGTGPDNVAAMRAFFNFSFFATQEKSNALAPVISAIASPMYAGTAYPLTFTFGGTLSNYNVLWTSSSPGTFTPNATQQSVSFTPSTVSGPTNCIISVTLTDKTCPLKTYTDNQTVQIACNLGVTTTLSQPCFGTSNGIISMAITGGTAPFNWSWTKTGGGTNSGTGTSITGLAAGSYSVTVVANGGAGCSATFPVTLTAYTAVAVTATPSPVLCYGGTTGSVTVSVTGGTPAYTYLWTGGATTQNRSGLTQGTYTVTVTDSKGCTGIASAVVTQPAVITVTPTVTHAVCNGTATGAISLSVSGGTAPYTYAWSDGPSTQNRTGLVAGTYAVTVTDAHNCTKLQSGIVVNPAPAITASASAGTIACNGGSTTLTVTASGGTGTLQYSLNGGAYQAGNTFTVSGSASPYVLTVKDGNNCTSTTSTTVTQPNPLTLSTAVTRATCPGVSNGAIDLSVSGGTTAYSYTWTASAGGVVPSGQTNNQDLTLLIAGTYSVTVTDAHSCTATTSAIVTNTSSNPVQPGAISN